MNRTSSYNLCQWEETDRVRRTDFNEDNVKIDQALGALRDGKAEASALEGLALTVAGKGNCRVAAGSYTGSGTYGVNSPNRLTFPFKPLAVFLSSGKNTCLLVAGENDHQQSLGMLEAIWKLSWTGNTLSWYVSDVSYFGGSNAIMDDSTQFNESGRLYHYAVIGAADT